MTDLFTYNAELYTSLPVLLARARRLMGEIRFDEAEAMAVFAANRNPNCAEAFWLLGKMRYARGRRYEAEPLLVRAFVLDRRSREAAQSLLELFRDIGQTDIGVAVCREMLGYYPGDPQFCGWLHWFETEAEEKSEPGFWMSFFDEGALIFDVGAHFGAKTDELLRDGAGAVVCIDPQPECVQTLQQKFGGRRDIAIVPQGLAEKPGSRLFSICSQGQGISTYSEEWKRGRFSGMNWDKQVVTEMTTLDCLIARYGCPAYCKIDVEGFEFVVLQGLTRPVPLLSFEFTHEYLSSARRCAEHLVSLGFDGFNVMIGDQRRFLFADRVTPETLLTALEKSPDAMLWGDIYAWCSTANADIPSFPLNLSLPSAA